MTRSSTRIAWLFVSAINTFFPPGATLRPPGSLNQARLRSVESAFPGVPLPAKVAHDFDRGSTTLIYKIKRKSESATLKSFKACYGRL